MRFRNLVAVAAVAVLVPLRAASATPWMNYCWPGTLHSCFSATLSTFDNGAGTDVELFVRNEGAAVQPANAMRWLTAIGFTAPSWMGAASGLAVSTTGSVLKVGDANSVPGFMTDAWDFTSNNLGFGNIQLWLEMQSGQIIPGGNLANGAIMGCGNLLGLNASRKGYVQTCAGGGYTGWVKFAFHTTGDWVADDGQIVVKFQGGGPNSLKCSSDPSVYNPADAEHAYCGPPTVIPEPVTMLLFGSGLAGIGAVGVVRRRRHDEDENS